jgi:nitrate reductase gamma subunit
MENMTLLDFARGPGLQWALWIFCLGVLWRVVGAMFLLGTRDRSKHRRNHYIRDGLRACLTRSAPAHAFEEKIRFQHLTGYAWHIALFVSVLLFAPHILFFESILGFGWPHLPNTIILFSAAIAIGVLTALLIRRATHPVQRLISNVDDYVSILVVMLPLISGVLAFAHIGARYETLLALHLLSVELLMIWYPFGKLMHTIMTFPSRYQSGTFFGHRGVKA